MRRFLTLTAAKNLPAWHRPVALLVLMAVVLPFAHSTWMALLNNFVVEVVGFDGADIGWLQSVREIPGLAAIGVIGLLVFIREQRLGLLITTILSSLGFYCYETVNQSLQLQWLDKANAPRIIGWIIAAVVLPALLGYMWLWSPMAAIFLGLFLMIPRHPVPGRETIFAKGAI